MTLVQKEVKSVYKWSTLVRPEWGGRLPSAYQEVEYIQSSGKCKIDTWFSPSWSYLKIETKLNLNSLSYWTPWNTLFIYGYTASNYCFLGRNAWSGNFEFWNGNSPQGTNVSVSAWIDYVIQNVADNWTQTININGNTTTSSCGTSLNTWVIPLFCRYGDAYSGPGYEYGYYATDLKVYYFKIYTATNTLARDFVPCYRKSDSVIGMYDLVNDVFYTNSWSGTFTKWSNV